MHLLFDSFWRALVDCLRPKVMLLSLAPLALMVALALGLGYLYWDSAVAVLRAQLGASWLLATLSGWFRLSGPEAINAYLAPLVLVFVAAPLLVVVSLLLVSLLMTPALTEMVANRRFAALQRKQGATLLASLSWSLLSSVLAMLALVVSVPLWLVPPLVLVLPPLIWGWLTYRVMTFDALAAHASADERKEVFRRHRLVLLGIGVFCGYLGAAPSVIWASGVLFAAAFVVLVPLGVWLYTLVFAFSSLWFVHFGLGALQALRQERAARPERRVQTPQALPLSHDASNPSSPTD
ncbi:MAG: hypothetical protein COW02_14185 [Comamonadaceae bacterium CG12_big_fil_rev_8_21_14_0_65_59_15]|nr:MAG: hypothetical protein COW02_14185 [Comamonadaceae bacterium CG12_big_fil_rev_8_21_14_0_65_59_15]